MLRAQEFLRSAKFSLSNDELSAAEDKLELDSIPEVEPPFDEFLDRERLQANTRHVLESLPERYRAALLWRYWERRSAQEMATQTGRSAKAIERLLARARQQFRRGWKDE